MPQRYTIFRKLGWGKYEGTCPLCDKEGTHKWMETPALDSDAKQLTKALGFSIKAAWSRSVSAAKNVVTAAINPRTVITNELTADGFGRSIICGHCARNLMVCSKCHAAYRYPTGATDFNCPNCAAKMFRI
jgi:LSD1 subclass zinc finger protein